jgi:hypothetical protein
MTAGNIDDAEPAMAEKSGSIFVDSVSIGTAVMNGLHHMPQVRGRARNRLKFYKPADSTH